ncbi:hypothetical protein ACFU8X_29695 [Brevibacillus porteri]|uniref:hypothetical protein n=1 Tax=Brevibacillus porteri TaxID=2126350 RepID=UPI00370B3AFF
MKKYRVDTQSWGSKEFDDIEKAEACYEYRKDREMSEGIDESSFVELVCSEDDFEDYVVIKRAVAIEDVDRMAKSTPKEEGYEWDYWAKWQEVDLSQR